MGLPGFSQVTLQDSLNLTMGLITEFHDLLCLVLAIILTFVLVSMLAASLNPMVNSFLGSAHTLEAVWTLLPAVILVYLAIPSLTLLYLMEDFESWGLHPAPRERPRVWMKISAHQWYWKSKTGLDWAAWALPGAANTGDVYFSPLVPSGPFQLSLSSPDFYKQRLFIWPGHWMRDLPLYPVGSGGARCPVLIRLWPEIGQLADKEVSLPTLQPILVSLTAMDVLHALSIPSLGIKMDAVPGRGSFVILSANRKGTVYGQCSELCGAFHSAMPFKVKFMPQRALKD